jgi:ribosomal protein L40E
MWIPVSLGPFSLSTSSIWMSESIVARISQAVIIISIVGFFRDLFKKPGRVSSRLVKRTFIIMAFVIGLYLPWDGLVYQMDLILKIILTVIGIAVWIGALGLLLADDAAAAASASRPKVETKPQTPLGTPQSPTTKKLEAAKDKPGTGICSNCGTTNPASGNFCKRCGTKL